ncbi:SpvB/TcaC N-terminal domain-containing protein [Streptomyces bobili]|uniref:SpvB/TcaC N-terminal domain-containing protein n=1 Tax=Streptomyces bobili TaxID=67280 RepID=UPI00378A5EB1
MRGEAEPRWGSTAPYGPGALDPRATGGPARPLPPGVPSVALPKGGGAIRGIGEKFTANAVTGTASLSLPLPLAPGRAGFGPELALSYDSGSGNGPFGYGWSVALPAVTRRTDRGVPRYRDAEDSDVFVLSGAEDLVPVLRAGPDGGWVRDEQGREVVEERERDGYTVRRYRPRVEGLFARIERWTRHADGRVHWRSVSPDNVTTLYGSTPDSVVADPDDPSRVFSWLISESDNGKGDAIVYSYRAEDSAGVDTGQAHERNRTELARSAQRHPKQIRYGNRVSRLVQPDLAQAEWLFEAVFDYGEHDTDAPTPGDTGVWGCRSEPFSSHRGGFELRSYRLCHRVLMFHHIPEPEVGRDCLVASLDLAYEDGGGADGAARATHLVSATRRGYRRQGAGYLARSYPAVEFEYSQPEIDGTVRELDAESLRSLPGDPARQWVDLDGDGAPGVLAQQHGAWYYKRNLGGGRLGPPEEVARVPSWAAPGSGRQQLLDLDGDGRPALVEFGGGSPGFAERTEDGGWAAFTPFHTLPRIDWSGPGLHFVDLDGDGLADVLTGDGDTFAWYRSLAADGFGPAEQVALPRDEEQGPRLVLRDGTQSLFLADMSGDGLTDLVRVRNGEICYWSNLGHGRFGAKVTMDGAPLLDHPDRFHPDRVRLADLDGSGPADLVYLADDGVRLYFNEAGNRWRSPHHLPPLALPYADGHTTVGITDMLGTGTACLVWSSTAPADARRPVRYVDLLGGRKPHLLVRTANNLGAETRIGYTSSTAFALADRAAGRPWTTRLPFPVQVVERVETQDRINRSLLVTRYTYHHGHFDGLEREFRGFGLVETLDTEAGVALAAGADTPDAAHLDDTPHTPPVLTRTWYHTGAHLGRERGEYYREPGLLDDPAGGAALLLDDTMLLAGLTVEDEREACRALKGTMLREEVYALDGVGRDADHPFGHPYTVVEQKAAVTVLQPAGPGRHAVCLSHPAQTLTRYYERDPADPRTTHELVLEVDGFGNVLKSAAVGYGRRRPDPALAPADQDRQARTWISYTEQDVTRPVDTDDAHRTPLPCQSAHYELTGYPATGPAGRYRPEDLVEAVDGRLALRLDRERQADEPPGAGRERVLCEQSRTLYRADDLSGLLKLGELQPAALPGEEYRLAFTPELLARTYRQSPPEPDLLPDPAAVLGAGGGEGAGYVPGERLRTAGLFPADDPDGRWWASGGLIFLHPQADIPPQVELAFAREHFHLPHRFRDPFHNAATPTDTVVGYDPHLLLITTTRDALGNTVTALTADDHGEIATRVDYRVLRPTWITDPNGNRTRVMLDALGLVAGTAVMGKAPPAATEGDSLSGFTADLTDQQVADRFTDPLADPAGLLGDATSRTVHDLFAYMRTKDDPQPQPATVHTLTRETYVGAAPADGLRIRQEFGYSDGFGRIVQTKSRAAGGQRWIGSGWTVLDHKGRPVRRYEPFFTDTHRFEFDLRIGVSPVLCYDPPGRHVATLHPDHTWEKTVPGAWRQEAWDTTDTVAVTDPAADPHVGAFFRALPTTEYLPTWHQQRSDGALGPHELDAARKTAVHAATPTITHGDAFGRTFLTVAHNTYTAGGQGRETVTEFHRNRVELDLTGRELALLDETVGTDGTARPRLAARYGYDLRGTRIHRESMDAGRRRTLHDAAGHQLLAWDSRGHRVRTGYDRLRRPTTRRLSEQGGPELLVQHTTYGEELDGAETRNLRGQVVEIRDQAGIAGTEEYDFTGRPLRSTRRLAVEYATTLDWSTPVPLTPETYRSSTKYDALDRPVQLVPPHEDRPGAALRVVQPRYDEAGHLARLDSWLDQDGDPAGLLDPATADLAAVTAADYDAKGRRTAVAYGNGARTDYAYDPLTFRLVQLVTRREPEAFPDDCPQPPTTDRPGCQVQNLHYTYDTAGNITHLHDDAQQTVFTRNTRVEPSADHTYDAIGRLVEATGREHLGRSGAPIPSSHHDAPRTGLALPPGDDRLMGRYTERYRYDAAGNILELVHRGSDPANPGWTRSFSYLEPSLLEPDLLGNRLTRTTVGSTVEECTRPDAPYDAHGNLPCLPHLQLMEWDFDDQLRMIRRQAVSAVDDPEGVARQGERTYYRYGHDGRRVRKVTELATGAVKEERRYLGDTEIHRRHGADPLVRETLHLTDGKDTVALVETRTEGSEPVVPARLVRYQYRNHLGSAVLELDATARIVSYEEYTPYGSTSYQAARSRTEAPKRYRFTARERDEESGLYHHGARYYAPWLTRWAGCDPAGETDGPNLYRYVGANPVGRVDPSGLTAETLERSKTNQSMGYEAERTLKGRLKAVGQKVVEGGRMIKRGLGGSVIDIRTATRSLESKALDISTKSYRKAGEVLRESRVARVVRRAIKQAVKHEGALKEAGITLKESVVITVRGAKDDAEVARVLKVARETAKATASGIKVGVLKGGAGRRGFVEAGLMKGIAGTGVTAGLGLISYREFKHDVRHKDYGRALASGAEVAASGVSLLARGAGLITGTASGSVGLGTSVGGLTASEGIAAAPEIVGAFALGAAVGVGIQEGSASLSKRYLGREISPGQLVGASLSAQDSLVSKVWADPNKPAYTQTIGWKLAGWLTPTSH